LVKLPQGGVKIAKGWTGGSLCPTGSFSKKNPKKKPVFCKNGKQGRGSPSMDWERQESF